jgi:hypothetical protein
MRVVFTTEGEILIVELENFNGIGDKGTEEGA